MRVSCYGRSFWARGFDTGWFCISKHCLIVYNYITVKNGGALIEMLQPKSEPFVVLLCIYSSTMI